MVCCFSSGGNGSRPELKGRPMNISRTQLVALLEQNASAKCGTEFVSIDYAAPADMRKTGNPFVGRVIKTSTIVGMVGNSYENSVNNQRDREGTEAAPFTASAHAWGTREGVFVVKDGVVHSVQVTLSPNNKAHVQYLLDGQPIDVSVIEPWLAAKTSSAAHQGVEREVVVRAYRIDRIKAIRCRGESYTVEDAPATPAAPEAA